MGIDETIRQMFDKNPEFAVDLQESLPPELLFSHDFVGGQEEAEGQRLASRDQTKSVEMDLSHAEVMPWFDNMGFRCCLLAQWRQTSSCGEYEFSEEEIGEFESLEDDEKLAFNEIAGDFLYFYFDEERVGKIEEAVRSYLHLNECGKALKILRANAAYLKTSFLATQRAIIWQNVSAVDPRFELIADRYSLVAGEMTSPHVIFRANSTVGRQRGVEESQLFAKDLKQAFSNDSPQLADEDQTCLVEEMLVKSETMKHFDLMEFREFLLVTWRALRNRSRENDLDCLAHLRASLPTEAVEIADELAEDFSSAIVPSETTLRNVVDEVRVHLEDNNNSCWDALLSIRKHAPELDPDKALSLQSGVWERVARFDRRFKEIAEELSQLAKRFT